MLKKPDANALGDENRNMRLHVKTGQVIVAG